MIYQITVVFVVTTTLVQVELCTADGREIRNVDSDLCKTMKCIRKCYPYGTGLTLSGSQNMSEPFNISAWSGSEEFNVTKEYGVLVGLMKCDSDVIVFAYPAFDEDEYYLTKDGNLLLDMIDDPPLVLDTSHYCLDNFLKEDGTTIIAPLYCQPTESDDKNYTLNAYCMVTSCFFILLTVGVYVSLPKVLRKLPSKVLIAYLLSFFVAFLCLAIIIFLKDDPPTRSTCTIFTFIIYFSMLSAFSWINVMCYDIWYTFRGNMMSRMSSSRSRFSWYCAYAISVPTALTAMLAVFEYTDISVPIKPHLIVQKCFFNGEVQRYYLYVPLCILCIGNIILFLLTAAKIARSRGDRNGLHSHDSHVHNESKGRFYLYIKLFTVMGISWLLEVVSSFYPAADALWQVTDVYNLLVGFAIFVMFVCKKDIWEEIKQKNIQVYPNCGPSDVSTKVNSTWRMIGTRFSTLKTSLSSGSKGETRRREGEEKPSPLSIQSNENNNGFNNTRNLDIRANSVFTIE